MFIMRHKKIFISISALFVAVSIACISIFGLPLGIDFKGGSALELSYTTTRPEIQLIQESITNNGYGDATLQPIGEKNILIKSRELSDTERAELITAATVHAPATMESFTTIGPSVGKELKRKAIISIVLVLLAIICFVAYAFRKVSQPVSSWKYGFAVIIALIHDIIIPSGAFAVLAHITGAEVDTLFIVALLTTLALSISDTIVVFDRVRENLANNEDEEPFDSIVGKSLSQTFVRSINTSILVLVMIISLAVFGPVSTRLFATILAIGMFFGIYSSIFLASPLLVAMQPKKK